jgi:hypothetical protein
MRKLTLLTLLIITLISCKEKTKQQVEKKNKPINTFLTEKFIKNSTYQSDNIKFKLKGGKIKKDNDNYSIVDYATGDVNNDGINDLFILLKNNSQGSGVFYFTNLLIGNANGKLEFIEEQFIDDRIKPSYIVIYKENQEHPLTGEYIKPSDIGKISLGYYTRSKEQSFSDEPKLLITSKWKYIDKKLVRIEME